MGGRHSRQQLTSGGPLSYRHDAPILNDKYFPKAAYGSMANIIEEDSDTGLFKYPHLQLRNMSYSVRKGAREERILDMINIEARGGELVAILATSSEYQVVVNNNTRQKLRMLIGSGVENKSCGFTYNALRVCWCWLVTTLLD